MSLWVCLSHIFFKNNFKISILYITKNYSFHFLKKTTKNHFKILIIFKKLSKYIKIKFSIKNNFLPKKSQLNAPYMSLLCKLWKIKNLVNKKENCWETFCNFMTGKTGKKKKFCKHHERREKHIYFFNGLNWNYPQFLSFSPLSLSVFAAAEKLRL